MLVAIAALLDVGPFADDELTVDEFIAQGDEICSQAHDEFLDLQDGAVPRTPGDAADLTGALIDVAEEERDAIADLREPEALSGQVDRYLEARGRGIEILKDGRAAADDADPGEYERAPGGAGGDPGRPALRARRRDRIRAMLEAAHRPRRAPAPGRGAGRGRPSAPPTVNNPPTGSP